MKGQVTLPVVITAFILIIVVSAFLPAISTSIGLAVPFLGAQDRVIAYLVPTFFLLGPALMALGFRLQGSRRTRGRGV